MTNMFDLDGRRWDVAIAAIAVALVAFAALGWIGWSFFTSPLTDGP